LLCIAGFSLYLMDIYAEANMLRQYRAKALSIASSTASLIDGDLLQQIKEPQDRNTQAFEIISSQLRRVRNSNRHEDTWVKFITTVYEDTEEKGIIRYGVDAEESLAERSNPGDVVHRIKGQRVAIEIPFSEEQAIVDQWGEWLSANAPVRNSRGVVIGAVMVDIPFERVSAEKESLLSHAMLILVIALALGTLVSFFLARLVARPLGYIEQACSKIAKGDYAITFPERPSDEFAKVEDAIEKMVVGLKEREAIKFAFARYVSNDVLQAVISSDAAPQVAGERKRVTVLFCDIRGFTSLSERMKPEEVVRFLNKYFERVVEIVFRHKGTLDKFIGDGVMAIFGAPAQDPYQEENALKAAIEIQEAMELLRNELKLEGLPEIRIGIGINSGNAIVGNIGSSQRLEYTAIGDTVNLASRLESVTKDLGVEIALSEYTAQALTGAADLEKLGGVSVKGKDNEVVVYTVKTKSIQSV